MKSVLHLPNWDCWAQVKLVSGAMSVQLEDFTAEQEGKK